MNHHDPIPGIHPIVSFIATGSILLFGKFMPDIFIMLHYHIPPIVLELLQACAYMGTGVVGAITFFRFYNDFYKSKKKGKK